MTDFTLSWIIFDFHFLVNHIYIQITKKWNIVFGKKLVTANYLIFFYSSIIESSSG